MPNFYIVATPIGNLQDITIRALEILKNSDIIVCEDTRRTLKLLSKYNIQKPLISCHQQSTQKQIADAIAKIMNAKNAVYVSDSGTPGISDPGNFLIQQLLHETKEVTIIPIPGPSSLTALLSVSGFHTDSFTFLGFLPHKKGKQTLIKKIVDSDIPVAFFESPHRIMKTLVMFKEFIEENRQFVIGRELTKIHETIYRGNIQKIIETLDAGVSKGEFAIIVDRKAHK